MKTTLGASLSIIHGVPLDEEPGLGALTLAGYLREVTDRYADREALVMRHPDGSVQRWSYRELAIREFLKVHLASYKVPRRVLFMREEELVLTGSAKVQLGALRELAMKRLGGTDA